MIKKFVSLLSGPALAHALTILLTPYFMSKYTPSEFGDYAFYIALLGVFLAVSSLRFDAIIFACEDTEVDDIFTIGIVIAFFLSCVIFCFLFYFNYSYSTFIFFSFLSQAALLIVTNYFLRFNKHKLVSFLKFLSIFTIPIFQLIFSYYSLDNGMILGHFISNILFLFILILVSFNIIKSKSILKSYSYLIKYKGFSFLNSASVFMNSISSQILPLSIKLLFGSDLLGIINVVQRMFVNPVNFLLRIVLQVYNKEFSEKIRSENVKAAKRYFLYTSFVCLSIVSFLYVIIFFLSDFIFDYVNLSEDSNWNDFYAFIPFFVFIVLIQSLVIPVSQSLTYLGLHRRQFLIEVTRGFLFLTVILMSYWFLEINDYQFIAIYTFIQSLSYFFLYFSIFRGFNVRRKI
ncbi:TPA: hypothetical protein NJ815_001205 [Vibrio parahaemolyticus]|nr:hypothetical protein [Vibrio parahaemolyticus]